MADNTIIIVVVVIVCCCIFSIIGGAIYLRSSTVSGTTDTAGTSDTTDTTGTSGTTDTSGTTKVDSGWWREYAPVKFHNMNKCIGISGSKKDDNAQLISWDCIANNDDQKFKLNTKGQFVVKHSGKCLHIKDLKKDKGNVVVQYTCSENPGWSEKWEYNPDTKLIKNPETGLCFNSLGGDPGNGNNIGIWDCDKNSTNELFEGVKN